MRAALQVTQLGNTVMHPDAFSTLLTIMRVPQVFKEKKYQLKLKMVPKQVGLLLLRIYAIMKHITVMVLVIVT